MKEWFLKYWLEVIFGTVLAGMGAALWVHDVFTTRTVAPGETLVWTYVTEVAYPNP